MKGNIVKKSGSKRLYYDFMYLGERVEISTGLTDTPENRKKALAWLFCQREKIRLGSFRFCEAFPKASSKKKIALAAKEGTAITAKPQHVKFGSTSPSGIGKSGITRIPKQKRLTRNRQLITG